MKTIYLDSEYKCHASDDGTMTPLETDAFDGKCDAFVEGYRFIPSGQRWTRSDGKEFVGEMLAPHVSYEALTAAQQQYEADRVELEAAYREGVNSV